MGEKKLIGVDVDLKMVFNISERLCQKVVLKTRLLKDTFVHGCKN
jgi:hypothetical protein